MLRSLAIASALCLALVGCRRDDATSTAPAAPPAAQPPVSAPAPAAFRVAEIQLGSALRADKRIAEPTAQFAPTDTIFASVASEGVSPKVALSARWTYEDGQVVSETTETIAPSGPAVTEFHISKPSGWPVGKYRVEIVADGRPAGTRDFEVR
jgi:hypothetical protein